MEISAGDTAWVLTSSALVMLMTPALGFFYAGMARGKNVLATIMQSGFAQKIQAFYLWVVYPLIVQCLDASWRTRKFS